MHNRGLVPCDLTDMHISSHLGLPAGSVTRVVVLHVGLEHYLEQFGFVGRLVVAGVSVSQSACTRILKSESPTDH